MHRLPLVRFAPPLAFVFGFAVLAPETAAQNQIIPATAANADANNQSYYPFIYDKFLAQQIVNADVISPIVRPIRGVAFRRDMGSNPTTPFQGRQIQRFIVRVGYSKNSPTTMSTTFASNRAGALTTVFDGTFNLPTLPPATPPAPFLVQIPFNSTFIYQRMQGHLLLEFEVPGDAQQKQEYYLDAHSTTGTPAKVASYGTPGPLKSAENYTVTGDASSLFPGGALMLQAQGLASAYPTIAAYGFSNKNYGPLPLPFDLTPLGAPKNSLYTSLDLMFPMPLIQQGTTYSGQAPVPIPGDAAVIGLSVFGQVIFVDPPSNGLNLVFSNGVEFVIGEIVPTQVVGNSSSTQATGSFLFGNQFYGGPVIELQ